MKPLLICLLSLPMLAQVRFLPAKKLWVLETGRTSYVLGINEQNSLQNVYWGKKLLRDDDLAPAHTAPEHASFDSRETMTNEEYPGWGGLRYNEPCVKVTLADGTRDLVLAYVSHEIRGDTLEIHTKDIRYALAVDLLYRVYPRSGIVEKRSVIRNRTSQPVMVESAQSGVWYVPAGEGLHHLRELLEMMSVRVIPQELAIARSGAAFDAEGRLVRAEDLAGLREVAAALAQAAARKEVAV